MATLTKAELRARVLQHLGIVGVGHSASAADAALVDEAIDAAHARLRKFGLVPFATSAIPEYAQQQLRDYVAGEVSLSFGHPRFAELKAAQMVAERELQRQVAGYRHSLPIEAENF